MHVKKTDTTPQASEEECVSKKYANWFLAASFPQHESNYSWRISNRNIILNNKILNLNKVVPGAVVYYGELSHVMIVLSVIYDENSKNRSTSPGQLTLIEATYGTNLAGKAFGSVINERNLGLRLYKDLNWDIVRLRTNN